MADGHLIAVAVMDPAIAFELRVLAHGRWKLEVGQRFAIVLLPLGRGEVVFGSIVAERLWAAALRLRGLHRAAAAALCRDGWRIL